MDLFSASTKDEMSLGKSGKGMVKAMRSSRSERKMTLTTALLVPSPTFSDAMSSSSSSSFEL